MYNDNFQYFLTDFCNRQPAKDLHGSDSEKLYFETYAHSKIIFMDNFFLWTKSTSVAVRVSLLREHWSQSTRQLKQVYYEKIELCLL